MRIKNPWAGVDETPRLFILPSAEGTEGGDGEGGGTEGGNEAPTRPEFVPEKFWDPEKSEVRLEQAFKSYGDLERAFRSKEEDIRGRVAQELEEARLKARPASSGDYKAVLPDEYADLGISIEDDDPLVAFWREEAHGLGLSQEQFGKALQRYVDHAIKSLPDPQEEMAKLGDTGKVRAEAIGRWVSTTFSKAEAAALERAATTADGVLALEKIMQIAQTAGGPPSTSMTTGQNNGEMTLEQLQSMQSDPRYWDPMRREAAFVRQVDRGFEKIYGVKRA